MASALVIGGSRGIGAAIAKSLRDAGCDVLAASRADVDTSDLQSARNFARANPETDVLVLNTGGPPPKEFEDITDDEWLKYHNQLFLGMCVLLREIRVRDGGYVFLVSSSVIKEPSSRLVVSGAYRAAFSSVFKVQGKKNAEKEISYVNIAPGPTDTGRMRELVEDVDKFAESLPMKRLGRPSEIGDFVGAVVSKKIKYLTGAVISFDGAGSSHIF